jgi:agmatine deiminase
VFDETDGHIDGLARWVAPGEILLQWTDDPADPQHEIYQERYNLLSQETDARGDAVPCSWWPAIGCDS